MTAFLFFTMSKKLKDAQLIVENQIFHIEPAVYRKPEDRKESGIQPCETVEMFVSAFGILLGSKIIKFNQGGIRLKAVEIGRDYLSIDFGTDAEIRNTVGFDDVKEKLAPVSAVVGLASFNSAETGEQLAYIGDTLVDWFYEGKVIGSAGRWWQN